MELILLGLCRQGREVTLASGAIPTCGVYNLLDGDRRHFADGYLVHNKEGGDGGKN